LLGIRAHQQVKGTGFLFSHNADKVSPDTFGIIDGTGSEVIAAQYITMVFYAFIFEVCTNLVGI
jgi:hypothetical protein